MGEEEEEVIFKGELGIKRKKGIEQRFFVLYSDRFDYFKSEAEIAEISKLRGSLNLADVESVQFLKGLRDPDFGGITIKLPDVEVELAFFEKRQFVDWRSAFDKAVPEDRFVADGQTNQASAKAAAASPAASPAPAGDAEAETRRVVQEGLLLVARKGAEAHRYFVLFDDCLEYFEDLASKQKGQEPRGRVMLPDVVRFEAVKNDLSFSISAVDEKRPLVLKADGEQLFNRWLTKWASLLEQPLRDNYVVMDSAPDDAEVLTVELVLDGPIGVVKKGSAEPRHAVLWKDRFEYFNSQADFKNDGAPRCRIPLDQFQGFEHTDDGFVITLEDRTINLASVPGADLSQWSKAWASIGFKPTRKQASEGSGSPTAKENSTLEGYIKSGNIVMPRKGKQEQRYLAISSDAVQIFNSLEEVTAGTYPRMRFIASEIKNVASNAAGFEIEMTNGQEVEFECSKGEIAKWVDAAKSLVDTGGVDGSRLASRRVSALLPPHPLSLMEGSVMMISTHTGSAQRSYLRIYPDRFEYAQDRTCIDQGMIEKGYTCREVESVTALPGSAGFELKVSDGAYEIRCTSRDRGQWQEAWDKLMVAKKSAPSRAPPKRTMTTPGRLGEGMDKQSTDKLKAPPSAIDKLTMVAKQQDDSLAPNARGTKGAVQGSLCEGRLKLAKGRAYEEKYVVLQKKTDGCMLLVYNSRGDAMQLEQPQVEVKVSDITGFKVSDDGLTIISGKRCLLFKAGLGETETWEAAFRTAFKAEAEVLGASSPAPRQPRAASEKPSKQRQEDEGNWLQEATKGINTFGAMETDKDRWPMGELNDPHLKSWLAALRARDPPIQSGLLGVQPKGQMVTGYFVLFRDRLDFWNAPTEAASGLRPRGRIVLTDVRSLEMVSGGFILNYKGRKMGLHVRNNDELHEWSQAMLGALAPGKSGARMPLARSKSEEPGSSRRARSEPVKARAKNQDYLLGQMRKQLQDLMSANKNRIPVPPEATTITATELMRLIWKSNGSKSGVLIPEDVKIFVRSLTAGTERVNLSLLYDFAENGFEPSTKPKAEGLVPRVARMAEQKQARDRASPPSEEEWQPLATKHLSTDRAKEHHDEAGKASRFAMRTVDKPRRDGGFLWQNKHIADKVHLLDHSNGSIVTERVITVKETPVVEKINGDRVLTPRMTPGNMQWSKINHCSQEVYADPKNSRQFAGEKKDAGILKIGEEDRKPQQVRTCLTAKVNEAGRQPLCVDQYKRSMGERMAEKVTEAGRTATGWAVPYREQSCDRARSIAERVGLSTGGINGSLRATR